MPDKQNPWFDASVGRRIQAIRKQRGLTQRGLAMKAHVSYSCVTKVESGQIAASPAVTAACAKALRVAVTDLTGQPYMKSLRKDRLDELVQPLRHALAHPGRAGGSAGPPRGPAAVERELAGIEAGRLRGDYLAIGARVPALIGELTRAVDSAPAGERRERYGHSLAEAYGLARYFAHKLGFVDLGLLALERMERVIPDSNDPHLAVVVCQYRSDYLVHHGAYDGALTEVGRLSGHLEDAARRGDTRALSALGSMHLKAAVIHSRERKPTSAADVRHHLKQARDVAARTAGLPDPFGLVFDAANVSVHTVSTALDLGDPATAVEEGERTHLPHDWASNRACHHHIDMARAYARIGRAPQALGALTRARRSAPAYALYHPTTRETVLALLRGRGQPPPS